MSHINKTLVSLLQTLRQVTKRALDHSNFVCDVIMWVVQWLVS